MVDQTLATTFSLFYFATLVIFLMKYREVTIKASLATVVCTFKTRRRDLQPILKEAGIVVKPEWIVECWNSRRLEDTEAFEIGV
jgi:hypothetical protein